MKRTAFFLALVLFNYNPSTFAQKDTAPSGGISAAKILEGYLTATGGLDAHKALLSFKATGDFGFSLRHPLGNYIFLYKAPAKDVLEVQLISHGTSWTGRRDDELIRRSTIEGAEMINGAGMEIVEQSLMSLLEWDIRDYSRIEIVGKALVKKRMTYALRFTPKKGDPQVRFYDAENFLILRIDQVQRFREAKNLPETAYAVTTYFQDYRQYDALKLPQQIAVSRSVGDLIFDLQHVKTGIEIPDSVFGN